jgi:Lrp/AsnC family transcriptional regulator for asnA, asnC and gidA
MLYCPSKMKIDKVNTELIKLLMQNANVNSVELAKQLHVNSSTVRRRMKNLLEEGIINIVAVPDLQKIGLPIVAFISLEVSHEKIKSVLKKLSKYPNAAWLGVTSGLFNVRTVWWLHSTEELYRIIESEIGKIDGIIRIETSICLQIEKRESSSIVEMIT